VGAWKDGEDGVTVKHVGEVGEGDKGGSECDTPRETSDKKGVQDIFGVEEENSTSHANSIPD